MSKNINESVVVSVSFSENGTGVLIVGKPQNNGKGMGIVNAFEGEEARKLWATLTIKKGEPKCL